MGELPEDSDSEIFDGYGFTGSDPETPSEKRARKREERSIATLLKKENKEAYLLGALDERKRCIRLALAAYRYDAKQNAHVLSEDGYAIAAKIGKAQRRPPAAVAETVSWSLYGERKTVREVPSLLENELGPLTKWGKEVFAAQEEEIDRLLRSRRPKKELLARAKEAERVAEMLELRAVAFAKMLVASEDRAQAAHRKILALQKQLTEESQRDKV